MTSCQYSCAKPIPRQAREKVAVPTDNMMVLDSLSYSQSDRTARNTAENMKMRMKAGPARTWTEELVYEGGYHLVYSYYLILNTKP